MKKNINLIIIIFLLISGFATCASAKDTLVVTHAFFEPFVWSEEGVSKGIYVDVLKEAIEKRLKIPVKFMDYPWKRAQNMVHKGYADGFITLPTPERLEYAVPCSTPVARATMGIFTYAKHPQLEEMKNIQNISDLTGYKLLTYLGDGWAKKNLVDLDVDFGGKSLKEVLMKLSYRRGDILVQTAEVTRYNIKRLGYEPTVVQVPDVSFSSLEFKLLIGKQSVYLNSLPEIDRVFKEMLEDGTLDAISLKYQ